MTDPATRALRLCDELERAVADVAARQTVRVVNPGDWTSTEKPDLSFHTCTDKCTKDDDGEICEVTNEELRRAYNRAAAMLSSVRFMMGVPGSLGHDDGVESYEEAKRRADERDAKLRTVNPAVRRTRPKPH